MAAGLGFKTFATGDVLSAADVNGYLMQGVLVFASAAARDAAITSPQEGQFAYLKDTNVTTYYTGSAWTNLDTTGMVNPMTTTGDTIYSSSGSTPARLGIGSTGQVLTVAGGLPSWATPSGGGKVLQVVYAVTTTSTNIASTSLTSTTLTATITPSSASSKVLIIANNNFYNDTAGRGAAAAITRGATTLIHQNDTNNGGTFNVSDSRGSATIPIQYLDSPATTSATTYTIKATTISAGNVTFQNGGSPSNILLFEIGA